MSTFFKLTKFKHFYGSIIARFELDVTVSQCHRDNRAAALALAAFASCSAVSWNQVQGGPQKKNIKKKVKCDLWHISLILTYYLQPSSWMYQNYQGYKKPTFSTPYPLGKWGDSLGQRLYVSPTLKCGKHSVAKKTTVAIETHHNPIRCDKRESEMATTRGGKRRCCCTRMVKVGIFDRGVISSGTLRVVKGHW